MKTFLADKKIILASQSPRRQELLSQLGFNFEVFASSSEEIIDYKQPFEEIAKSLAKQKVQAVNQYFDQDTIIIGSDTIVCCDNIILGKPKNKNEAIEMLKKLSNKWHFVISSLCISYKGNIWLDHDETKVHFLPLNSENINFYIEKYAPFDKAGAYGIQEWIGLHYIDKIEGSFYTVMGFPTHLLLPLLKKIKI